MLNKSQKSKIKSQNFLEEIVKIKKEELQKTRNTQKFSVSEIQNIRKSKKLKFHNLFQNEGKKIKVIAELKFASPTNPKLGSSAILVERAKQYESADTDAISIITEKHFFKGDLAFIAQVKKQVSLPILQKDFIIDPIQIYEAKVIGTDALLLIARLVSGLELKNFVSLCLSLGIEPVVEINSEKDLKNAVDSGTNIIAVNARDLETFTIDLNKACLLIQQIPDHFIKLGFSGIHSAKEILQYKDAGVKGVLVGTSLMQTTDIKGFIESLHV